MFKDQLLRDALRTTVRHEKWVQQLLEDAKKIKNNQSETMEDSTNRIKKTAYRYNCRKHSKRRKRTKHIDDEDYRLQITTIKRQLLHVTL